MPDTRPSVRAILARNLRALINEKIKAGKYSSVENFAYSHGLDKSGIYQTLKKKRNVELETAIKWARSLGVTLDDLYPMKRKRR